MFLILFSCLASGCQLNVQQLFEKAELNQEPPLIKVELFFTDKERLVAYVKGLGIEDDGEVYAGGTSMNYIYDKEGNVIGSFNYQRLIYMKILPKDLVAK